MPHINVSSSWILFLLCLWYKTIVNDCLDVIVDSYHDDEIHHLPGLPWQPKFKHYSGYLKSSDTRRLHYWLVESERSPDTDPLVLWLNGGPGCSSLNGLFTENGPYLTNDDGQTLRYNDFAWNKIANVMFLESPVGVGFSYATDEKYQTDDDQTADDNYRALVYFFEKFPHYKGREIIITGESYAGVYIPTLMDRLGNDSNIKLRGAMIGNGMLNSMFYFIQSNIYYWHNHALMADSTYRELQSLCCGDRHTEDDCEYFPPKNFKCGSRVLEETLKIMSLPINNYNIYAPCKIPTSAATSASVAASSTQDETHKRTSISKKWAAAEMSLIFKYFKQQNISDALLRLQKLSASDEDKPSFVPCYPAMGTMKYLNRDDVREAINMLPREATGLPTWSGCSSLVDDATGTYRPTYKDQLDVLKRLVSSSKFEILLYYGDADFVCSFITGRYALHEVARRLQLELAVEHQPWYYHGVDGGQQIGGYIEGYNNFLYLTFKGSGHMVPTDQPARALDILTRYLDGSLFGYQ